MFNGAEAMKRIVVICMFLMTFLSTSCIDEKSIKKECQNFAEDAVETAWDQCTGYYEDEILPLLLLALKELQDTITRECSP